MDKKKEKFVKRFTHTHDGGLDAGEFEGWANTPEKVWQWIEQLLSKQREEMVEDLDIAKKIVVEIGDLENWKRLTREGGVIQDEDLYMETVRRLRELHKEDRRLISKYKTTVEYCDDCGKELPEGEVAECADCEQKSRERAMWPN